jgi:hypothetical protein
MLPGSSIDARFRRTITFTCANTPIAATFDISRTNDRSRALANEGQAAPIGPQVRKSPGTHIATWSTPPTSTPRTTVYTGAPSKVSGQSAAATMARFAAAGATFGQKKAPR